MTNEQETLDALKAKWEGESDEYHAAHAAELEAAYAAFAGRQVSNPAQPGEVTQLTADVVVTSEDPE
jgi:pyruvate/2-oxoglutarate/acetoin dehydrogenase E1 component